MKKRILVFIVIFIILISIGTCLILFLNHENKSYRYDELINLGYSKSDIKVIDGKLNI